MIYELLKLFQANIWNNETLQVHQSPHKTVVKKVTNWKIFLLF